MFGFSKTAAGIEVCAKTIRAVKVRRRGKTFFLEGFEEAGLPEGVLAPSYTKANIADMNRFKEALQVASGCAGIARGDVCLSIPDQIVKVSVTDLKGVPPKKDEILKFIKWKSKKLLPYDPEVAKIDYCLLGDRALAAFIKQDVMAEYEEALFSIALRPKRVSVPSIELFNIFLGKFGDSRDFAFIYVLADSFAVIIVRNGIIDFHRSRDLGFNDGRIMQEIASSIHYYVSEHQDFHLSKVFLHAGTEGSGAIAANLSAAVGINVDIVKVSEIINVPRGLSDVEPYAPAIAAALQGL